MGFYRGPRIVTDGLVLYLDAANPKSYPGNGVIWKDLSSTGSGAMLINEPLFESENFGSLSFNGNGKKAVLSTPMSGSFLSVSFWHKRVDSSSSGSWRTFLGGVSSNVHHLISQQTSRELGIFNDGFIGFGYEPIADGVFNNYTLIYRSGISASLYVNSNHISTISTNLDLNSNPIGVIGNWYNNSYWAGNISSALFYSKPLSEAEILQNYNATKTRFQ